MTDSLASMHATTETVLVGHGDLIAARTRLRQRNALGSVLVSTGWGREAAQELRAYILSAAANANVGIDSVADLSRATGIKQSVFSKWFSGAEQPSVRSLQKLAPVIKAPLPELLVLARRVSTADLGMAERPEPHEVIGHPFARELDRLLAEDSPLPDSDRNLLAAMVDATLARFRSTGRRRSA